MRGVRKRGKKGVARAEFAKSLRGRRMSEKTRTRKRRKNSGIMTSGNHEVTKSKKITKNQQPRKA